MFRYVSTCFDMFTRASKKLSTLTRSVKALLIILPKHSLTECKQCNGKRKIRKQREDAAQKGNKFKASWGPRGNSPCSPPPLGGPVYAYNV